MIVKYAIPAPRRFENDTILRRTKVPMLGMMSATMTVMLSRPPLSLAISTSRWTISTGPGNVEKTSRIS